MKQLYELNFTIKTVMALLIYFSVCKPVVSVKTAYSFAGLQSVCYKYIYKFKVSQSKQVFIENITDQVFRLFRTSYVFVLSE